MARRLLFPRPSKSGTIPKIEFYPEVRGFQVQLNTEIRYSTDSITLTRRNAQFQTWYKSTYFVNYYIILILAFTIKVALYKKYIKPCI